MVTGAGGFIGSHLAEKLVELGAQTRALVHYRSDNSWGWLDSLPLKKELEVFAGDVRDADSVLSVVKGVEIVFHLAALIGIPYSYYAPVSYVRTNIEGTLNILQAARDSGVERVVHTSTSEVYGTARYIPINESHPLQAQSPYAASKVGADKLAESFFLSFNLPVVIMRPFNTYGPRQSARAVVPTIITQCLSGNVVRLGNLYPTRDLNYVANTADGFLSAASSAKAIGRTINLGSGKDVSIEALVQIITRLMDRDVVLEIDEERTRPKQSEVERLVADNTQARELLEWEPKISLEDGLRKTIDSIRDHLHKYRASTYVL